MKFKKQGDNNMNVALTIILVMLAIMAGVSILQTKDIAKLSKDVETLNEIVANIVLNEEK